MINLTSFSEDFPIQITIEEYDRLVLLKDKGWTNCETATEWLAKLHYLREGYKKNKLSKEEFLQKEQELILKWWHKWC